MNLEEKLGLILESSIIINNLFVEKRRKLELKIREKLERIVAARELSNQYIRQNAIPHSKEKKTLTNI